MWSFLHSIDVFETNKYYFGINKISDSMRFSIKFIMIILLLTSIPVSFNLSMPNQPKQTQEIKWPHHKHRHSHMKWRVFPFRYHIKQVVFVCEDDGSRLFHRNSACIKLTECKGSIISVTRREARMMGRHKCSLCY